MQIIYFQVMVGASIGDVFVASMVAGRGCDDVDFTFDMTFADSVKLLSHFLPARATTSSLQDILDQDRYTCHWDCKKGYLYWQNDQAN